MVRKRVSEPTPVQVYLAPTEHARLERLADRLATSKSEILRQGIRALERQVTDPEAHPTLRLIGLGEGGDADAEYNAAVEHDRFIAESEQISWTAGRKKGARSSKKRGKRRGT